MSKHGCIAYTYYYDESKFGRDSSYHVQFSQELYGYLEDYGLQYSVLQLEECPTTGRYHIQGYFYVGSKRRLNTWRVGLQKHFPGMHVEIARLSGEANLRYCSKSRTRIAGTESITYGELVKARLYLSFLHIPIFFVF